MRVLECVPATCCPKLLSACDLVRGVSATYHWLYKLHTVILRRIVRSCDHDTDPFPLECPRSKSCDETDAGKDGIENIATTISEILVFVYRGLCGVDGTWRGD